MQNTINAMQTTEEVKKAIRSVQSRLCRLNKQKSRPDYSVKLSALATEERLLKARLSELEPKKLTVTTMTTEQLQQLDYNETIRAIKSIQSKKCLENYNDDRTEYNRACAIEAELIKHRENIKPVSEQHIRKSDIVNLINYIEDLKSLNKAKALELLNNLINN